VSALPLTGRRPGPAEDELDVSCAGGVAAVKVDGLSRRFGAVLALTDVALEIHAGEIHALVGPNGAGKTTLLRLLTGLLQADTGSARVLGIDPFRSPRELRRRIGVVPSGTRSFYLRISGFENLLFFARLHGLRYRAAASRAKGALEAVDLSPFAHAPVSTYSTGMQRRLAVARATLHDPALLLIDEATHDLDPEASARVRGLVAAAAARGAGVLWTTQRLEEIRGFAGAVTLLDKGEVRFAGTVPQLLGFAHRRQYLVSLDAGCAEPPGRLVLSGIPVASLIGAGGGEGHYLLTLEDDAILGDALDLLSDAGARVTGCSDARPSVEEAFLSLVSSARG
jgi:ABC-2 type transport system ATP-binding protein